MSHVATCEIDILDLTALARAAAQCGLQFNEGKTTFNWYGTWVKDYHEADAAYKHGIKPEDYGKCAHTLSVPGDPNAYEVGVIPHPDGRPGYTIVWDFYAGGRGLMKHIGRPDIDPKTGLPAKGQVENADKLRMAYTEQVTNAACLAKGFQILRSTTPEGKVVMRAVRR